MAEDDLGTLGVTSLNENLNEAEFGLQAEQDRDSEDQSDDQLDDRETAEGETDARVELVSDLDTPGSDELSRQANRPAIPLTGTNQELLGRNQPATLLVLSVEEVLASEGGVSLQEVEAQRQQDLQSTLPGVDPPSGSPNALTPAALQQVLNEATDAVRSGAAGGVGGTQP
jgi:hypothetical protein